MIMVGVFYCLEASFDINAIAKECFGQDDIPFYSVQNLEVLFVWVNIANFALLCDCSLADVAAKSIRKGEGSAGGCHGSAPLTMTERYLRLEVLSLN